MPDSLPDDSLEPKSDKKRDVSSTLTKTPLSPLRLSSAQFDPSSSSETGTSSPSNRVIQLYDSPTNTNHGTTVNHDKLTRSPSSKFKPKKYDHFNPDIELEDALQKLNHEIHDNTLEISNSHLQSRSTLYSAETDHNQGQASDGANGVNNSDTTPVLVDQNHEPQNTEESSKQYEDQIRLAKHLSSLFLNTRKVLRANYNIADPIEDTNHVEHMNQLDSYPKKSISISRSTLMRAKKVESSIGLKYMYIQRIYDWSVLNRDSISHPGVEGIYNPLQILRNRRIRAKYHEYPKQLSTKILPLPSNVFSENNENLKKPWKMIWAIELSELLSDTSWRTAHWNELRKPNGDLWFPMPNVNISSDSSTYTKSTKRSKVKKRLHDKIFRDNQIESDDSDSSTTNESSQVKKIRVNDKIRTLSGGASSGRRLSSVQSSGSDGVNVFQVAIARPTKPKKKHIMKINPRKLYKSTESISPLSSSESESEINQYLGGSAIMEGNSSTSDEHLMKDKTFKKLRSFSQNTSNEPPQNQNQHNESSSSSELLKSEKPHNSLPPIIKIADVSNDENLAIHDVSIKPVVTKKVDSTNTDESENVTGDFNAGLRANGDGISDYNIEDDEVDPLDSKHSTMNEQDTMRGDFDLNENDEISSQQELINMYDHELATVNNHLQFIDKNLYIKTNYLINIYPNLVNSVQTKLNHILNEQVNEIIQSTVSINDDILPAYEMLYNGLFNEVKSLIHVVNDVYAVKIDHLLSVSDRSIGEINTSLSLEVRKVNEKLDKLNISLFSNIVTEKLKDNDLAMNLNNSGNHKALYYFLENLIVISLKLIWFIVSIARFFIGIIKFIWKVIRFVTF